MRVVAIVNGYTGALCLQELVDQGDEVVAVITPPTDPRPGATPETSPKLVADRNYLPVYQPPLEDINKPEFVAMLRKLQPDLFVSMHYAMIFKEELLSIPRLGCVNEHPSRLPAGRGMTPSFWHMLIGDTHNWITLHYLNAGIDKGDVIAQGCVEITPDDTGATSARKLSEEGHRIFAENLPLIREGKAPRIPQKDIPGVVSSYYSWKPHYARIDWNRPAEQLALHVRTLTRPRGEAGGRGCAYTFLAGQQVNIRSAVVLDGTRWQEQKADPGEILAVAGEGLLVKTGKGNLLVKDADVAGAEDKGLVGLFDLLATGLPTSFS